MQVRRVAHFHYDVHGHGAYALQKTLGHTGLVARHHHHGHGFAYGAANAQDDGSQNTASGCGNHRAEHAGLPRRPQRKAAFEIAFGYCANRRFRLQNDRRQNHHRQQDARGEHAVSVPAEGFLHKGHDGRKPEEAVDHRRDAGQQRHRRLEHPVQLVVTEPDQIDRRQYAQRRAQKQGAAGDIHAAQNHGQNSEDFIAGPPGLPGQKLPETDLPKEGDAVGEQEEADQQNRQDTGACGSAEHAPHGRFTKLAAHGLTSGSLPRWSQRR